MAANIEYPSTPSGTPEEQLVTMYNYLYRMAEALNANLAEIGSPDLTDGERAIMNRLLPADEQAKEGTPAFSGYEAETLKSLIIKTASFVQKKTDEYRMNLLGEYVASGKFGRYVRNTNLKLDITPEGIQQDYTFEAAVQGERDFEINTRQFIRTGLLRTESSIPIYGVQVGKDICEFKSDGTVEYHDGNKVAELTADALTFYTTQNQTAVPLASLSGTKLSFYVGGVEFLYIDANGIHATKDMTIDSGKRLSIRIGSTNNYWQFDNHGLCLYDGASNKIRIQYSSADQWENDSWCGVLSGKDSDGYGNIAMRVKRTSGHVRDVVLEYLTGSDYLGFFTLRPSEVGCLLGTNSKMWSEVHSDTICGRSGVLNLLSDHKYFNTGKSYGIRVAGIYTVDVRMAYDTTELNFYYSHLYQESSRDIKHNIRDVGETGEIIDRLRPRKFVYDRDRQERDVYGLIYEETEEVIPEICTNKENDKALDYIQLVPVLLKEIQDLRRRVAELEGRNNG